MLELEVHEKDFWVFKEKDLKRLLDMYQLWAHDMFPRTDFSESVQKIEKECKKRVMAVSWLSSYEFGCDTRC